MDLSFLRYGKLVLMDATYYSNRLGFYLFTIFVRDFNSKLIGDIVGV